MDWRVTVTTILKALCMILIFTSCSNSVEGNASLLGVEHNFIKARQSGHHHHHHFQDQHEHTSGGSSSQGLVEDFREYHTPERSQRVGQDDNSIHTNSDYDDYYDADADRSYKYEFVDGGYSRSEESDPSGNVVGSYSFIDGEGKARSLSYRAGANIGFVPLDAKGLHPEIMAGFVDFGKRHSPIISTSLKPLNQRVSLQRPAISSSNRRKTVARRLASPSEPSYSYPKPTEPASLYLPPVQDKKPSPSGPDNNPKQGAMMMDRSYSFDFSEDNLLREEAADPSGNVQGRYSYTNRDGNEIEVRYSAGAEKGFVIENEVELAKAVAKATKEASATTVGAQGSSPTILDVRKQYSGGNGQLQNKASDSSPIHFVGPKINADTWVSDGTYEFGYKNADSERSEVADKDGTVTGSYVLPDAYGNPITVRYHAGPEIGFVIDNLDEVNARSVPKPDAGGGSETVQGSSSSTLASAASSLNPQRLSPSVGSGVIPPASYDFADGFVVNEPPNTYQTNSKTLSEFSGEGNDYDDYYDADADRSYSFKYSEDRGEPGWISNREEEADAEGTIKGRYSYVNDDGNEIAVQYRAGADIGFVVENKAELEANVRKATEDASRKRVVKVKGKRINTHKKDDKPAGRRMVVKKGRRREPHHKKTGQADTLSILKVSSSSKTVPLGNSNGAGGQCPSVSPLSNAECTEAVSNCWSPGHDDTDCPNFGLCCFDGCANRCVDGPAREAPTQPPPTLPPTLYSAPKAPTPTSPPTIFSAPIRPPPTLPPTLYSAPKIPTPTSPPTIYSAPKKPTPTLPPTLYSPPKKPTPTSPPTLYSVPKKPTATPFTTPSTLYSAPEASRSRDSFPIKGHFVTPQGNLLNIQEDRGPKDDYADTTQDDYNYDYYEEADENNYSYYNYEENHLDDYNYEDYEQNRDASFSFSVESDEHSHQETSDANGERFGSYSYLSPTGETVVVKYRAGINGFEILNPEDVYPKSPVV